MKGKNEVSCWGKKSMESILKFKVREGVMEVIRRMKTEKVAEVDGSLWEFLKRSQRSR